MKNKMGARAKTYPNISSKEVVSFFFKNAQLFIMLPSTKMARANIRMYLLAMHIIIVNSGNVEKSKIYKPKIWFLKTHINSFFLLQWKEKRNQNCLPPGLVQSLITLRSQHKIGYLLLEESGTKGEDSSLSIDFC